MSAAAGRGFAKACCRYRTRTASTSNSAPFRIRLRHDFTHDLIDGRELREIGQEQRELHRVRQRPAGRARHRVKIAKGLPDLRFEARPDQLAGLRIEADLPRRENDEPGLDRLRVRSDRGGRRAGGNDLFVHGAPSAVVDEGSKSRT